MKPDRPVAKGTGNEPSERSALGAPAGAKRLSMVWRTEPNPRHVLRAFGQTSLLDGADRRAAESAHEGPQRLQLARFTSSSKMTRRGSGTSSNVVNDSAKVIIASGLLDGPVSLATFAISRTSELNLDSRC
jgi:hypothetical protein